MASEQLLKWLRDTAFKPGAAKGRKIGIFSPPGEGKTVLAAKLGKRNLIISDEDGYTSLLNHPMLKETCFVVPFKTMNILAQVLQAVEDGEFCFPDDDEPFDNVILDTVSGMVSLEIQRIVKEGVATEAGKVSKEVAGRPDYLVSEYRFLPVANQIATMKRCSVTLLFHPRIGDKLTPADRTRPDVHAAVFKLVNKYLSVIAYLRVEGKGKDTKRILQVMPTGNGVTAKTRYHFPSEFVTDDEFVAHIEKWKDNN